MLHSTPKANSTSFDTTKSYNKSGLLKVVLLGSSTLASSFAAPVMAQEQNDGLAFEEIIVSATRREQSIMDVPYNINAISGSKIERSNVLDTAELLRSVAGVAIFWPTQLWR